MVGGDPWKVLAVCLLLNRATGTVARRYAWTMFARWPTPDRLANAGPSLERLLAPLGFTSQRPRLLREMSAAFARGSWDRIEDLPGCGRYAADAWAIVIERRRDVEPSDGHLRRYLEETA